jgi:hypothetical protein
VTVSDLYSGRVFGPMTEHVCGPVGDDGRQRCVRCSLLLHSPADKNLFLWADGQVVAVSASLQVKMAMQRGGIYPECQPG